jgi:DMSO reductase family type II enzyme chaperone
MPTRFEQEHRTNGGGQSEEWAARPAKPPRSILGNYPERARDSEAQTASAATPPAPDLTAPLTLSQAKAIEPLQTAIDIAVARSFLYRFLAQAYADPSEEAWAYMSEANCQAALDSAVRTLAPTAPALARAADAYRSQLRPEAFEGFHDAYLAAFGHAARGRCPLNEIEYGDIKADPLFQPHRLADLAAFYRAFGLEVAEEADERHDHLSFELEFMCVLAAKEAYALEHQLDPEDLALGRDAQRRFLRDHLGRWTPAFTRRLARMAAESALGALADFTRAFVEAECARQGIAPGSEDLLLRPVDEAAESVCQGCGPSVPSIPSLP